MLITCKLESSADGGPQHPADMDRLQPCLMYKYVLLLLTCKMECEAGGGPRHPGACRRQPCLMYKGAPARDNQTPDMQLVYDATHVIF